MTERPHWSETILTAADAESAAEAVIGGKVKMIITDVRMGNQDGFHLYERLTAEVVIPAIVYTGADNPTFVARAAALDVFEYVRRDEPFSVLADAIDRCWAGEPRRTDSSINSIADRMRRRKDETVSKTYSMTDREAQVLRHLAMGLSNREIATSLNISIETVKEHVQNVLRKMPADDRTSAAVKAVKAGIVS